MRKGVWTWFGAAAAALLASGAVARDVPYLGIATERVSPAIGRHLGFGEGVGIEVVLVDPEGAARGILEEGDILVRFNDQWLVNHEQLAVLVRRQKPGDKVTLTFYRDGQSRSADVKLGKIDERRLAPPAPGRWAGEPVPPRGLGLSPEEWREWMEELWPKMMRPPFWRRMQPGDEPGEASPAPRADVQIQTHSSAVISETREGVNVTVTVQDGRRSAKISKDGQVVFEGPVNDDAELAKIPAEYRDRVSEMLKRVRIEVRGTGVSEPPEKKSRGGTGLRRGNVL